VPWRWKEAVAVVRYRVVDDRVDTPFRGRFGLLGSGDLKAWVGWYFRRSIVRGGL
jgi:hypothetical protein